MLPIESRGDLINGRFVKPKGNLFESTNPARHFEVVFKASSSLDSVQFAVESAKKAFLPWFRLDIEERKKAILKLKTAFEKRAETIAKAITLEMGKSITESRLEAQQLSLRVDLILQHGLNRVAIERPKGILGEVRYHPQGPLAVLGPFNFPAHLINAHVIPALLLGNTVVIKPSEICPWVGELYANCAEEAELPPGVFNLVQGGLEIGKALVNHPDLNGILFTGSYETGKYIKQVCIEQPHKIDVLEMGGKNSAIVLEDADLEQALYEIVQGAFLTTGQRCTATSRLLLQKNIAQPFLESLLRVSKKLLPGNPMEPQTIFGPLATKKQKERFLRLLEVSKDGNCDVLLESVEQQGGAFVTPSIYLFPNAIPKHSLDVELFGPNLCVEIVEGLEEAIHRANQSMYGLSNAIFTRMKDNIEHFYRETRSGVLNWNRGTHGSSGQMPFGGVSKSGNQRPAGIDAVRYVTYPVSLHREHAGEHHIVAALEPILKQEEGVFSHSISDLAWLHGFESLLERYGIHIMRSDPYGIWIPKEAFLGFYYQSNPIDAHWILQHFEPNIQLDHDCLVLCIEKCADKHLFWSQLNKWLDRLIEENPKYFYHRELQIQVPADLKMPRSESLLRRLYAGDFVPREKKAPVVDLRASRGAYLVSVDPEPLMIFDSASQIASLGVGFAGDCFQKALDEGTLLHALLSNKKSSIQEHRQREFEKLLLAQTWEGIRHVTFAGSGAEANEKALELCRSNGAAGKRLIAFEGAFHGRTWMALQATFNPEKRAMFQLHGHEAAFVPFPVWNTPSQEPIFSKDWIEQWSDGHIPKEPQDDELACLEIVCLQKLKQELEKGDICAVFIEPMQCEGGDRYATARFFNGLRALTRFYQVALVFDEVQTGFGLLGPFFAHRHFQLRDANGELDGPDCVTLAKKAQLGVVLSRFEDKHPKQPHAVQLQRGLLHAKTILGQQSAAIQIEKDVQKHLLSLKEEFPFFVIHPRAKGFAFAFDLPSAHLANQIINQRFYRGFMVYLAGEKTLRFRMHLSVSEQELNALFTSLKEIFLDLLRYAKTNQGWLDTDVFASYVAPSFTPMDILHSGRPSHKPKAAFDIKTVCVDALDTLQMRVYEPEIREIENASYESNRRDSIEKMRSFVEQEGGLCLIMTARWNGARKVIGYTIGGPLEHAQIDGTLQDPLRGQCNTFYSANLTLIKEARGFGLGRLLKEKQIQHVASMRGEDGRKRYWFITGRHRLGRTHEMHRINQGFGAYTVSIHEDQYGEKGAKAMYYRIPLRRPKLWLDKNKENRISNELDWSEPIEAPLGDSHPTLIRAYQKGLFNNAAMTKLTLSNFVTPDVVRYAELLKRLAPSSCKHVYLTSGQEEMVDKGLRCLRVNRQNAQIAIGFSMQYLGLTTATARSLTHDDENTSWFDWPIIPHPTKVGIKNCEEQLLKTIEKHTPESILGIVIEPMGQKTGYVVSDEWLQALDKVRHNYRIPLIYVETASALGRNGQSLFFSDALPVKPNMVWWYAGGQLGHVFVDDQWYVSKPLTLISTWDGDEICMQRTYVHLMEAYQYLSSQLHGYFEKELKQLVLRRKHFGKGLWHALEFSSEDEANWFIASCEKNGLFLQKGFLNHVLICPSIGLSKEKMQESLSILQTALNGVS